MSRRLGGDQVVGDPRGICPVISTHLSGWSSGQGLHHYDEAARRWFRKFCPEALDHLEEWFLEWHLSVNFANVNAPSSERATTKPHINLGSF